MSASLRKFLITRILLTIPMVLILITLVFLIMRILPGDPIRSQLGPRVSEEQANQLRERLGLNRPLIVQYGEFLWQMVTFDFGTALTQGERPIKQELAEKLPATIELSIPAVIFMAVFGVGSGAYAAKNRKKPVDYLLRLFSIVIYSIPIFFMGLMFQIAFSVKLPVFPLAGRMDTLMQVNFVSPTHFYVIDAILTRNWPALGSALMHLILPSFTLGLALTGVFIRLTRVNMIEILQSDFITAGRARGISERRLVYKHALRNTFIPILTLIGLQFAALMAGAVLTETTFSWPGIGRYLVERIQLRDYTAVQSTIGVFAMFVAAISLIMDVLYAFVDPRIRY
ncbi:ABC-type dipeptide/oligopeptide/nickel transport system, permease component [Longilinea arvoryzae]|uniref:ABC-type dipeptide/oligopeptide/nickel transport system, permease component n=1 Tax=Longilinea arvoryzae TaxID=360412 RepID=A0A0S7B6W5_9CHLR|nr:ABC transporter permease [Longilinea arvoryzae]GAP13004.1 ABC-type dipeptide/oligopeptide/nickel transport system, permease component [Longilinea arvoryzae]